MHARTHTCPASLFIIEFLKIAQKNRFVIKNFWLKNIGKTAFKLMLYFSIINSERERERERERMKNIRFYRNNNTNIAIKHKIEFLSNLYYSQ